MRSTKRQSKNVSYVQEFEMSEKNKSYVYDSTSHFLRIKDIPEKAMDKILNILGERSDHKADNPKAKLFFVYGSIYFNPVSQWTSLWNFIIIMNAYLLQFLMSLTIALGYNFWLENKNQEDQAQAETVYLILYISLLIPLLIDIFVNFNKGYYAFGSGRIIDDKNLIAKKYLKYHFPIDIITLLILILPLIIRDFYLNFLQLLPMVLLYIKKFKCQDQIISSLKYNRTLRNVFILVMLACDVMLMGNFGACIFLGIDLLLWKFRYYGDDQAYYWLSNDTSYPVNLMDGPWTQQYIFAQSFSSGTLSSLAPGPFGKNPIQIFYAIVIMTFFMLLASYAGQILVQVLSTYQQVRIFHQKNIQKFDQFMTLKGVSDSIKQKVQNFFELIWEVEVKMDADGQKQTLNKFPLILKEQLLLEMGFCRYLKLFNHFSNSKILERQISMKIQSEVIDQGTIIFQDRTVYEFSNRNITYLKDGLCKFYFRYEEQQNIIALSNAHKIVGQFELITGLSYGYCCKAIDLCVVQKIKYFDFIALIQGYGLMEEFYQLKYRLLCEQQFDLISKYCMLCEGQHLQIDCQSTNIGHDIRKKRKQSQGLTQRKRKKYPRKQYKTQKVLLREIKLKSPQKIQVQSIWSKFKNLNRLILQFGNSDKHIGKVQKFTKYFPEFNI